MPYASADVAKLSSSASDSENQKPKAESFVLFLDDEIRAGFKKRQDQNVIS
jgi:hypothetical protein